MTAYYNEIAPYAAQWLRNLIDAGHIAPGVVDTRSIEDVRPDELFGFTQCHFFAGLGGWSLALRLAGWPDDRPAWTGSCPCQPFSSAGKGTGFADERHLWPAWQHLIAQCQPPVIFGEQVASKAVEPWIDLVHADLEGMGYAFGCVPFPAAGVGAPHIRDRTYWVAHAHGGVGAEGRAYLRGRFDRGDAVARAGLGGGSMLDRVAYADGRHARTEGLQRGGEHGQQPEDGGALRVGNSNYTRLEIGWNGSHEQLGAEGRQTAQRLAGLSSFQGGPGPTNGLWRDADWLQCRDGKWRPVEPGTFPLAHGVSGRVGRLRAYGNAIVAEQASQFVKAHCEEVGIDLILQEQAA